MSHLSPYVLGLLSYLGDGKYCTGNPIVIRPANMPEVLFDLVSSELEDYCLEIGQDCLVVNKDKFFQDLDKYNSLIDEKNIWQYIAGAFDKQDQTILINWDKKEVLVFKSKNPLLESAIARLCNVSFEDEQLVYRFNLSNYVDFVCNMAEAAPQCSFAKKQINSGLVIKFAKCHEDAIIPYKKRPSDSGYDVVVINKLKTTALGVEYWRTGIKCEMPAGWYMDLVPRSSLSKKGYTVTNCVGIIDQSYKGEIVVVVHKTRNHTIEIQPGDRIAQLIPRKTTHFQVVEVSEEEFVATERQAKGFGSSGDK